MFESGIFSIFWHSDFTAIYGEQDQLIIIMLPMLLITGLDSCKIWAPKNGKKQI